MRYTCCVCSVQVDLVLLPAVTGDFGVMPGHVPTVAQLRPGVVTVHKELDKQIEKFFVSSGFAFVHADSATDVVAVEAVNLEDLDTEAVRAGLQVCFAACLGRIQFRQRQIERPVPLNKKEDHTMGLRVGASAGIPCKAGVSPSKGRRL